MTVPLKSSLFFNSFYCFFVYKKTLRLNNLKTRSAMNAKVSVFVICVGAIIYLLLYSLHDCTFNPLQFFLYLLQVRSRSSNTAFKGAPKSCFTLSLYLVIELESTENSFRFALTLYFPMFPFDPLKISENQRFSDVFRGIKREHWEVKG